jgi:GntR family transcriptional regulator, transcriptional repressor for pyruvate dehydrogenase complex
VTLSVPSPRAVFASRSWFDIHRFCDIKPFHVLIDVRSEIISAKPKRPFLMLSPSVSRTQELIESISAEILSGRLSAGSKLPTEQELSARTGVSRTVVREAVAALRADNLVVTRRGLGAFVTSDVQQRPFRIDSSQLKSAADVIQILELRLSLEVEASGLAAERRTAGDIIKIKAALNALDAQIESGESAVKADFDFHLSIFRSTRSRYFPELLLFLGHFIIPRQRMALPYKTPAQQQQYLRRIQAEHTAMFEAILEGNASAARRAARRHLSNSMDRYRDFQNRAAEPSAVKKVRASARAIQKRRSNTSMKV